MAAGLSIYTSIPCMSIMETLDLRIPLTLKIYDCYSQCCILILLEVTQRDLDSSPFFFFKHYLKSSEYFVLSKMKPQLQCSSCTWPKRVLPTKQLTEWNSSTYLKIKYLCFLSHAKKSPNCLKTACMQLHTFIQPLEFGTNEYANFGSTPVSAHRCLTADGAVKHQFTL